MAETRTSKRKSPPDPSSRNFQVWLTKQPREWSTTIASRAAARALPFILPSENLSEMALWSFGACAIARFAAKYPNRRSDDVISAATVAATRNSGKGLGSSAMRAQIFAAFAAREDASAAAISAEGASTSAALASDFSYEACYSAVLHDAQKLYDGELSPEALAASPVWPASILDEAGDAWRELRSRLEGLHQAWEVWVDWYENVLRGLPGGTSEDRDAVFTDLPGKLPWDKGAEVVNAEIARRLAELRHDPAAIKDIPSPIAITVKSDGRIGADAGVFNEPILPAPLTPADHSAALVACRSRAEQLLTAAKSPTFQWRKEYAEALAAYLDWLPSAPGVGNILLADGEARVLNKLFVADEEILATGFAGRLSVLLEDHIALRTHYPELERHYEKVRTGRVVIPLARDAVEGIRQAIHENTPSVFHESVSPAMDETAKPIPEISQTAPEDKPPADPGRPKPPKDPITAADPGKSRNFTFASAANRIWEVLQKGKDLPQVIEGWQKAYDDIKPHIGQMIDWLHKNWPGGGDGMPPLPPMGSA